MSDDVGSKRLRAIREDNNWLTIENHTLKSDIGYWKSRHNDAFAREEALKEEQQEKNARIKYLTR